VQADEQGFVPCSRDARSSGARHDTDGEKDAAWSCAHHVQLEAANNILT
jgi:hypothetical protein